jgi:hypothetical protein
MATMASVMRLTQLWQIGKSTYTKLGYVSVATLALGSQPRQGVARLRAKREAWELGHMLPGVQESVRE